jgi:uncharacterized coiled-coil DUF342 family protein
MSDTPETDDLARGNHVVPTDWAEQLEKERDDVMAQRNSFQALSQSLAETCTKLKTERDKAREKIERQRERIAYLEGATHHACGTPLSKAIKERNEARHEIEGWRNKWECAVDMAARAENQRDQYKALLIRIYNDINVLHTGEAIRELTREFRDKNFN